MALNKKIFTAAAFLLAVSALTGAEIKESDLILKNGAVFENGVLKLDGKKAYAKIKGSENMNIAPDGLSLSCAVKLNKLGRKSGTAEAHDTIFSKSGTPFIFGRESGKIYSNIRNSAGKYTGAAYSNSLHSENEWTHLAVTYQPVENSLVTTIYRNGKIVSTTKHAGLAPKSGKGLLELGKGWGGVWFLDGELTELNVEPRVLTAAEIAKLYADSKFVKKAPVAKKTEAPEAGLLLACSFDKFTTQPDYIANPVAGYLSGIQHELQLRMYKGGVNDKGNAVLLNNSEFIGYRASGNFNARQGSLLLWVKPLNWKSSTRGFFQVFFEVREKDYRFVLYKLNSGDQIAAYIKSGKKTHLLSYDSVKRNPGQWHQLAVTWNSNGVKLYIDGVPPRHGSQGEKVFKENPDFPAELKWGTIWLNPSQGWVTNKERTTAYDDLKIYNRVLSPAEILTAYEKVMLSQKNILPLTSLPVTLPVTNPVPESVELQKTPTVSLYLRGKNLVADFAVPYPAVNYNLRERDGKLWLNDGVEIHVLGNNGKKRQFMINPAGTLYDSLNGNAKWNSQAEVSAKIGNGQWSASASIPLADLGVAGNSFKANFCISAGSGKKWNYTWSPVTDPLSGFADVKYFGEVSLRPSTARWSLYQSANSHRQKLRSRQKMDFCCKPQGDMEYRTRIYGKNRLL